MSVLLVLSNGDVARGDCVSVQYPGAEGRDPLLKSSTIIDVINRVVRPLLVGARFTSFRKLAQLTDEVTIDGQ